VHVCISCYNYSRLTRNPYQAPLHCLKIFAPPRNYCRSDGKLFRSRRTLPRNSFPPGSIFFRGIKYITTSAYTRQTASLTAHYEQLNGRPHTYRHTCALLGCPAVCVLLTHLRQLVRQKIFPCHRRTPSCPCLVSELRVE